MWMLSFDEQFMQEFSYLNKVFLVVDAHQVNHDWTEMECAYLGCISSITCKFMIAGVYALNFIGIHLTQLNQWQFDAVFAAWYHGCIF